MKDQKTEAFGSVDLYLGSYLKASGVKLIDVDKSGRRTTFLFEDGEHTRKLVKEFYDSAEFINSFVHCLKDLKAIIYNM